MTRWADAEAGGRPPRVPAPVVPGPLVPKPRAGMPLAVSPREDDGSFHGTGSELGAGGSALSGRTATPGAMARSVPVSTRRSLDGALISRPLPAGRPIA